ncbi:MAG: hypothetical protein EBZ48_14195 [Proteobacteria bacterium]|nr:hypothetical protein [Pseudomonadota bacterium]
MQGNSGNTNSSNSHSCNPKGHAPSPAGQKKLSDTYKHQINILKALTAARGNNETRPVQIDEIALSSGLKDERETQRFLYILEGQKLVAPFPAGDFTSRHWVITQDGVKALRSLATPTAAAA